MTMNRTLELRFFGRMIEEGECWRWIGAIDGNGYGNFWAGPRCFRAHRWSWEFFNGEIPEGLQLDHLCRNRWCVKPWHLDPVTQSVNTQRAPIKGQPRKTVCKSGHIISDNEYVRRDGFRRCRSCLNEASTRYKRRKSIKQPGDS